MEVASRLPMGSWHCWHLSKAGKEAHPGESSGSGVEKQPEAALYKQMLNFGFGRRKRLRHLLEKMVLQGLGRMRASRA